MRVAFIVLGLGWCAACAASPPSLPDSTAFGAEVLAGRIDLEHFDFAAAGYWSLPADRRLRWLGPVQQALFGSTLTSDTCDPVEHRRFNAVMWLQLLMESPDAAVWKFNARALRERLGWLDGDLAKAVAAVAPSSPDPRVAELQRRIARDQGIRDNDLDARWPANLPPLARQQWFALKLGRMMAIDCADTVWLRAQLEEIGWFDIDTYGKDADKNAWLLVQHADRNKEFQRSTLGLLQALPPGKTDPKNLAYLWDRVAMGEQRPQRYGTQGQCAPDGTWKPLEVEEPAKLDERRASIGLEPIAEHAVTVAAYACPKSPK